MSEQTYQKTVLVVDDMPTSMEILVRALGQANFRVLIAESGQEALQILQQASLADAIPDIILLDVSMPGIDGFETCRQIKATPEITDIPVLFVTAHDEPMDLVRGFDVGGADYIRKPINLSEVQARINTHLTMHRLRHELLAQNDSLTRTLQEQIVQLEVEAESRKQTIQELERLLEERDRLLEVVYSQSEHLGGLTSSMLASQNEPQQSMIRMLSQQMQEKLASLRIHLNAVHAVLGHDENGETAGLRRDAVVEPHAIEHLEASLNIVANVAEQAAQMLADLEKQSKVVQQDDPLMLLSSREREVLALIAKGKDNSEIATVLHIEPTTVRTHRARIMSKLDAKNAYDLVRIALQYQQA